EVDRTPRKMRLRNRFAELRMFPAPILVGSARPRAPKKRCPQPSFPSSRCLEDHPPDVPTPSPHPLARLPHTLSRGSEQRRASDRPPALIATLHYRPERASPVRPGRSGLARYSALLFSGLRRKLDHGEPLGKRETGRRLPGGARIASTT